MFLSPIHIRERAHGLLESILIGQRVGWLWVGLSFLSFPFLFFFLFHILFWMNVFSDGHGVASPRLTTA
jgi:hypothetical protein